MALIHAVVVVEAELVCFWLEGTFSPVSKCAFNLHDALTRQMGINKCATYRSQYQSNHCFRYRFELRSIEPHTLCILLREPLLCNQCDDDCVLEDTGPLYV